MNFQMQIDKNNNQKFFEEPRVLCPFRSMSLIFQQLPPPHCHQHHLLSVFFHSAEKDRREGRWCVTDATFRPSVREINIDTVFLTRGLLTVCVGLWFHYPLLSHFFLKNQTITDVATEIETVISEGLSEQVILPGGSAISPVCCGTVNPPRIPGAQRPFNSLSLVSSKGAWAASCEPLWCGGYSHKCGIVLKYVAVGAYGCICGKYIS